MGYLDVIGIIFILFVSSAGFSMVNINTPLENDAFDFSGLISKGKEIVREKFP
jgi:hypothetical protein